MIFDRLHDALDGRFEKGGDVGTKNDIVHPRSRYYVKCIPKKFQMARVNVEFGIFIAMAAKQDTLRHICVLEPELGSIVETFYYAGYIL